MIAAIAGDIIGSVYERRAKKTTDFPLLVTRSRFTDDTVMTVAVADCLLHGHPYAATLRSYGRRWPAAGYGGMFRKWLADDAMGPYQSYGNGSAMRVSPVGWAMSTLDEVMAEARRSAECTHDHPDGIAGAQALASAVFLAHHGASKSEIREHVERTFGYDLHRTIAGIRGDYRFDVTCAGSVPEALIAFLDGDDVEQAIRLAVSLGGDSDTQASMAGAVAQAFYKKVSPELIAGVEARLDPALREVTRAFCERFAVPGWP
jgi:ADP-ribosylglycohydrolase